jgi:glyoxylate reductase
VPKSHQHIVVTTHVSDAVLERLRDRAKVSDVSELPRPQWDAALSTATGLLVNSAVKVDAATIAAAPKVRIVATVSVGYDNVDLAALAGANIALTNTRGALVEAVADLAFSLVIIAQRRLAVAFKWVRSGRWMNSRAPFGHDLADATLGIVGLGEIGSALARRARTSGMRVVYSNRRPRTDDDLTGATFLPFERLLAEADCIVILVPLSDSTRGLFDDTAFARMKPSAALVNVARGPVVHTDALLRALERGKIATAVLDVTDPQPLPPDHPLLLRDDVVVTPHMGSATEETRERMAQLAAENLLAEIDGRRLLTPVELPGTAEAAP